MLKKPESPLGEKAFEATLVTPFITPPNTKPFRCVRKGSSGSAGALGISTSPPVLKSAL